MIILEILLHCISQIRNEVFSDTRIFTLPTASTKVFFLWGGGGESVSIELTISTTIFESLLYHLLGKACAHSGSVPTM